MDHQDEAAIRNGRTGFFTNFRTSITIGDILLAVLIFVLNSLASGAIQYLLNEAFRLLNIQSQNISAYASLFFVMFFSFIGFAVFLIIQGRRKSDQTLQSITKIANQNKTTIDEFKGELSDMSNNLYLKLGYVEYVDDLYSPKLATPYKGNAYETLMNLFEETSSAILALSIAALGDKHFFLRGDHINTEQSAIDSRNGYFSKLESTLAKYQSNPSLDLKYTRIFQVPEKMNIDEIEAYLDPRMIEHCLYAISIEAASRRARQSGEVVGKVTVEFKIIRTQRLTGFMILDSDTVVIFTGGVVNFPNPNNPDEFMLRPYHAGILVFQNQRKVYYDFLRRFETLEYESEDIKQALRRLSPKNNRIA